MNDVELARVGEELHEFVSRLYPLCRSITGNGVRETLRIIGERIPLEVFEIPTGTQVFDWRVPKEWNINGAYIKDSRGRTVVDFADHNLHVVSYSVPVRTKMSLPELRPHLHSLPEHPDWIPYRTSYYRETWGFCLTHRVLETLQDGLYEVVVDSTLQDGSLTYAECVVPGQRDEEILVYTHTCHPSLANDNASGMAVVAMLAEQVRREKPSLTHRFVFGPGTIGSITWLAHNESKLQRIRHGLVVGLVGDPAGLTYKSSRDANHVIDRAARNVVSSYSGARLEDFAPYGYDERQFCSPGINLPVGRLTRSGENRYPEYHSSADDLSLVRPFVLAESLVACRRILRTVDSDARYRSLSPKGEPQLGRRGLYRATGGTELPDWEFALLWVLNQSDGGKSLLGISERSGLPFETIAQAAQELETAGLLARIDEEVGGALA